jgi:hypothetical protein
MPKLKSGRHFGLAPSNLAHAATSGTPEQMYAFALTYRLEVKKPEDLCNFLPVIYYKEGEGEPPKAPAYDSGFLVMHVLDGKAGWSEDEINELRKWLSENKKLQDFLEKNFNEIDLAIKNSPLWRSEFMRD